MLRSAAAAAAPSTQSTQAATPFSGYKYRQLLASSPVHRFVYIPYTIVRSLVDRRRYEEHTHIAYLCIYVPNARAAKMMP